MDLLSYDSCCFMASSHAAFHIPTAPYSMIVE